MNTLKKIFWLLLIISILAGILSAVPLFAQESGFVPLEGDVPLFEGVAEGGINRFFQNTFRFGIGIASGLAVLMIVIAGFQYMTAESGGSKSAARSRITNAVLGLLLALSTVIIIQLINPEILELNFLNKIQNLGQRVAEQTEDQEVVGGGSGTSGASWPDDTSSRQVLIERSGGAVSINNQNCRFEGQSGCTSLAGLPPATIAQVIRVSEECNCLVEITGGTEEWLHRTHGPGKAILDFSARRVFAPLSKYITSGTPLNPDRQANTDGYAVSELSCFEKFTRGNVVYQWEGVNCSNSSGDHWHVIF